MAIEGPLRELGIHDVFQLLDLSRKTGCLHVASALRDNEGHVYFRQGRVIAATIRSNPHLLGTVLLRDGRITEAELAQARVTQEGTTPHRRLGEILLAQGVLSTRELDRYIRRQVETVTFELLSWQEGFFSFAEGEEGGRGTDGVTALAVESLLMEGARRLDEWTQIQQRVPHLGVVPCLADFTPGGDAPPLDLLPAEWEVLAAMDGERDLRQVATALNRSEFDVARTTFGLVSTGIIVVREPGRRFTPREERSQLATVLADAREALQADDLEPAASHAATAVALAPEDPEARYLLARALLRQGREVEGEEELRVAQRAAPLHTGVMMESARLSMRRGEIGQAITWWQRVVAAAPGTRVAVQAREAVAHAEQLAAMLEAVDA
jgi:tetratricopeptide (TPR) repeat protein